MWEDLEEDTVAVAALQADFIVQTEVLAGSRVEGAAAEVADPEEIITLITIVARLIIGIADIMEPGDFHLGVVWVGSGL